MLCLQPRESEIVVELGSMNWSRSSAPASSALVGHLQPQDLDNYSARIYALEVIGTCPRTKRIGGGMKHLYVWN